MCAMKETEHGYQATLGAHLASDLRLQENGQSPMTQLSRNLSGASLASAKKAGKDKDVIAARRYDMEAPSTSFAVPTALNATPVLKKIVPVKYSQVCSMSASSSLSSVCDEDSPNPKMVLAFDDGVSPSDDSTERVRTERMEMSQVFEDPVEVSPARDALLSPSTKNTRVKRKLSDRTPAQARFFIGSPGRAFPVKSPITSPSKRGRLSFRVNDENVENADVETRSKRVKLASGTPGKGLLSSRLPLRTIQDRHSLDEAQIPAQVPPSPMISSPSAPDGFSELLLDEDANFPQGSTHSTTSDSLNSLISGSIKFPPAFASSRNTRRDLTDEKTEPKSLEPKDSGFESSSSLLVGDFVSGTTAGKKPVGRSKGPLLRAASHTMHTPAPGSVGSTVGARCSKLKFEECFDDDGSSELTSRANQLKKTKSNDENATPTAGSTSNQACKARSADFDTKSCPIVDVAPTRRRFLLHSVSEEPQDAAEAVTLPSDLHAQFSCREERTARVEHAGGGKGSNFFHFRSESALSVRTLKRSTSDSHAIINRALKRAEQRPNLIADFSRQYCLPIVTDGVKHPDLKNISPETLAKVLRGEYADVVTRYTVIDCRFPYEYEGGHITGAVNVYTKDQILKEILPNEPCPPVVGSANTSGSGSDSTPESSPENCDKRERTILIFHCEFSSERGPSLARFLRSKDRALNAENYPALHFPEMYLLQGGYKAFFESYPELCTPSGYRLMLDPEYSAELKHFKSKAKTWSGGPMSTVPQKRCKRQF